MGRMGGNSMKWGHYGGQAAAELITDGGGIIEAKMGIPPKGVLY